MIAGALAVFSLPKSARLLKKKDFSFRPFQRTQTDHFKWVFTRKGSGRIGISLSKRVLRRAVARNRVRRLIREAFRLNRDRFAAWDLHVIGLPTLTATWKQLDRASLEAELQAFFLLAQPIDRRPVGAESLS